MVTYTLYFSEGNTTILYSWLSEYFFNLFVIFKGLDIQKDIKGSKKSMGVDNSRNIKMGSSIKNLDFLERQ